MTRLCAALCASMLLLIALPVLLAIAFIALISREHPLFIQERVGRHGAKFNIIKFRTLTHNESAEPHWRSSLFSMTARTLRRTRLDEIPQLINIIRGEMSFVGPRPLTMIDYLSMPGHRGSRLNALPGLTGLAQVRGGSLLTPREKLELDLVYLENRSTWMDLSIMFGTVRSVLFGDSYAISPSGASRGTTTPARLRGALSDAV